MKKLVTIIALASMVPFAATVEKVTSKQGGVDLRRTIDGEIICTAPFGEEMQLLKREGNSAFVKALCAKGWVPTEQVQKVVGAKSKSIELGPVSIDGSTDNNYLQNIFNTNLIDPPEVEIKRDFRDFLTHTVDRESQERAHGEN